MLETHSDWAVCGDALNGAEAVTKAVQLRPDLIILDFPMPVLDGMMPYIVCRTIWYSRTEAR